MNLENKVAFVTGAAGGIGRASCMCMAREGASIVAVDLTPEGVNDTVEYVGKEGYPICGICCDISSRESVEAAVEKAVQEFGRIDILFNNAGIVGAGGKFLDSTEEEFDKVLGINLKGSFLVALTVARQMKEQGGGRIINTSSVSALQAEYGGSIYCISKAGVSMLNQALAIELGEYGIQSVAICPGHIKTPMLVNGFRDRAKAEGKTEEEYYAEHTTQIPIGRFGEPEEIGELVTFLACNRSSYINGCGIIASGGQITH